MRGICVKDWEAIALRDDCKTSIRRLVQVPASAEFLGFKDGLAAASPRSRCTRPETFFLSRKLGELAPPTVSSATSELSSKLAGPTALSSFPAESPPEIRTVSMILSENGLSEMGFGMVRLPCRKRPPGFSCGSTSFVWSICRTFQIKIA